METLIIRDSGSPLSPVWVHRAEGGEERQAADCRKSLSILRDLQHFPQLISVHNHPTLSLQVTSPSVSPVVMVLTTSLAIFSIVPSLSNKCTEGFQDSSVSDQFWDGKRKCKIES